MDGLYYLWIGPKPNPLLSKGMDTVGPVLSRKRFPSTPIYFFCLDEYCDHYQAQLNPLGIHVQGIFEFLMQKEMEPTTPDKSDLAVDKSDLSSLYALISRLIYAAQHVHKISMNSIREYVTIKALMQYLLPIYYSGYFLDTNVIPTEDSDTSLQSFSEPKAPFWEVSFDPWMVYSPENDANAMRRYFHYFDEVLDEYNVRETVEEIDRTRLGSAFVSAFSFYQDGDKHKFSTQEFSRSVIPGPIRVSESGFYKRYSNSHKREIQPHIIDRILSHPDVPLNELHYYLASYQGQLYSSIENKSMFFYFFFSNLKRLALLIPYFCKEQELYAETIKRSFQSEMQFTQTVQLLCTLKSRQIQHSYFFRAYHPRSPSDLESLKKTNDLPTLYLACQTVLANGPLHDENINCYLDTMSQIGFINGLSQGNLELQENLRSCLRQSIGLQNPDVVQRSRFKTDSFVSRMEAYRSKRKEGFFERQSSYRNKSIEENRQEGIARLG